MDFGNLKIRESTESWEFFTSTFLKSRSRFPRFWDFRGFSIKPKIKNLELKFRDPEKIPSRRQLCKTGQKIELKIRCFS